METILIPTDFSESATNALRYGIELAKYFDARVVFVNSYPIPPANYETGTSLDLLNTLHDSSVQALQYLKAQYPEHQIDCFSEMGYPYDVIENAVKKYNADLIVMGIVGESGGLKHLIGSNATYVARHIKTPCFIIPDGVTYHRIHKIAFACDFDKVEENGLLYVAKCFSALFDAELEVVNVDNSDDENDNQKIKKIIDEKLRTIDHTLTILNSKHISDGITKHLKNNSTDILMLNPKKHNLFYYLFNENVTKELAFSINLPLLTIH